MAKVIEKLSLPLSNIFEMIKPSSGVHSRIQMKAAGLDYTGEGDMAKCKDCAVEISNWTAATKPFSIHATRSPNCPFVLKMRPPLSSSFQSSPNSTSTTTTILANEPQTSSNKHPTDIAVTTVHCAPHLHETKALQQARRGTFCHWPQRTSPSKEEMIEAGLFSCNVDDRVICIYCNLICEQWPSTPADPWEVHKILSPKCMYVQAKLMGMSTSSGNRSSASAEFDQSQLDADPVSGPCHPQYAAEESRKKSFQKEYNTNNSQWVNDLVAAGLFRAGHAAIVTCFFCNGSLQGLNKTDSPMIEHARCFPKCTYAKQLCGDGLHGKIQEWKRREESEQPKKPTQMNTGAELEPLNESDLACMVPARLDLPMSRRMLSNFKLSIIKRCWENQLKLKHDDFVSETDLFVACQILQKQLIHIDGKKKGITNVSVHMQEIRERNVSQTSTSSGHNNQQPGNSLTNQIDTSAESMLRRPAEASEERVGADMHANRHVASGILEQPGDSQQKKNN